jgi:hypothetical protein
MTREMGDPFVEDHPGARLRQHGRVQASVYTQDINRAFRAMREMYTGNGHREAGVAALDVF